MSPLNALIFGLGLFFLGLRLIGENLRQLAGPGLHAILKRTAHSPLLAAGLGLGAGALMQSATAVTFIMVSMVGSGLITAAAASPIIIWCNVGLTALAFVTTLNIHPLVGYIVGGAGIALGTIRARPWQTIAGAILGMGLILCGLQAMGDGAAPLKDAAWFRNGLDFAVRSPLPAFAAGILAAALLQSNTGAAMLVITFAGAGAIDFTPAMLMIFGTNLGAIVLRMFLSAGLKGRELRLVRLEDLFCLWSGILMAVLFLLEQAGVPLIGAALRDAPLAVSIKLAIVFLLSNLLPALVMSPFLGACRKALERVWPDREGDEPGRPKYLRNQALDDPPTALDLLSREIIRLLRMVRIREARGPEETGEDPPPDFEAVSEAIESFAAKLASRSSLTEKQAAALHALRALLSIVRHIEEAVRFFDRRLARCGASSGPLANAAQSLLEEAALAMETRDAQLIAQLREKTKQDGPWYQHVMGEVHAAESTPVPLDDSALEEDFTVVVWTLRRLSKVLQRQQA